MPGQAHEELERYVDEYEALAADYQPSEFWTAALAHARVGGRLDVEGLVQQIDDADMFRFRFESTKTPLRSRRVASIASRLMMRRRTTSGRIIDPRRHTWEHYVAIGVIEGAGLAKSYDSRLQDLGVKSSMSVARHHMYASLVRDFGASDHFLEIGGGAGNLATMLLRDGVASSYCIVDLPEMLFLSGHTFATMLPEHRLRILRRGDDMPAPAEGEIVLVPAPLVDAVPRGMFDCALNFLSFMEMDLDTRDDYIARIYEWLRPRGWFININRHKPQLPGRAGIVDNNPLRYPYRVDDEVVDWREDPFHSLARQFGLQSSNTILRAARRA